MKSRLRSNRTNQNDLSRRFRCPCRVGGGGGGRRGVALEHSSVDILLVLLVIDQFLFGEGDHLVDLISVGMVGIELQNALQRRLTSIVLAEFEERFALSKQRLDVRSIDAQDVLHGVQTQIVAFQGEIHLGDVVLHLNELIDDLRSIVVRAVVSQRIVLQVQETQRTSVTLQTRRILFPSVVHVAILPFLLSTKERRIRSASRVRVNSRP